VTDFSDRILNCIPSRNPEQDWQYEDAVAAEALAAAEAIPESKDIREEWWHIDDQGRTGSCVGWATANSVLRWHFVKSRRILQDELLSARYVWMASKESDIFTSRPTTFIEVSGTSLKAALDIARNFGVVKETVLPFDPPDLFAGRAQAFYAIAARLKIGFYVSLGRNPARWKEWLAARGPILTRLDVDDTWYAATGNGGKLPEYKSETAKGGHAIALVGYTPSDFIVRNSWGTDWGDDGFGYATEEYADAAFTEAYGVVL
jgi:C1A family cysteine protease